MVTTTGRRECPRTKWPEESLCSRPDFDAAYWKVIGEFVRNAVSEAQPHTPYEVRELLTITARHTLYCWQTLGLPLERVVVFQRGVIAEYIDRDCPNLTPGSRGTRRAQLFSLATGGAF